MEPPGERVLPIWDIRGCADYIVGFLLTKICTHGCIPRGGMKMSNDGLFKLINTDFQVTNFNLT